MELYLKEYRWVTNNIFLRDEKDNFYAIRRYVADYDKLVSYTKLGKGMYVCRRKGVGLEAKKHALQTRIHNSRSLVSIKKNGADTCDWSIQFRYEMGNAETRL